MSESDTQQAFPSLTAMRNAHRDLLRQFRSEGTSDAVVLAAQEFIRQGCATGTVIDVEEDRWAAQGLLDYWATMLYRLGKTGFDASLDEFDKGLAPEIPDEMCPYLGLSAFSESEEGRFFGRGRLISSGITKIEESRFLAIIGPSGSGKSSLMRAGILPRLKEGGIEGSQAWYYLEPFLPGSEPLNNLAQTVRPSDAAGQWLAQQIRAFRADKRALEVALDKLTAENGAPVAVFAVDEFEDLFMLSDDEEARMAIIDNITYLARPDGSHYAVLSIHTDAEALISNYPELQRLLAASTLRITPPNAAELRQVIEEPANEIGLKFEEDLVDRILQDVSGEQTVLPLLQFTLLRLWDHRQRNLITWDAYKKVGGGREAVVSTANAFYTALSPQERLVAKNIFNRLVHPSEGMGISVQNPTRRELLAAGGSSDRIEALLQKLLDERLIRVTHSPDQGDDQFEIVHESLAQDWAKLVEWLDEQRFEMRQRLRLRTAADQWQSRGRDRSALWRGVLLEEALSYKDLSDLERDFVNASREASEAEERTKEEARQREIKQAQELAELERRRAEEQERNSQRLRLLSIILAVAAIIAILASILAVNRSQVAEKEKATAQVAASTAQAAATTAREAQRVAINAEAAARAAAVNLAASQATTEASARLALEEKRQADLARATAEAAEDIAQENANLAATAAADAAQEASIAQSRQLASQAFAVQNQQIDLALLLSLQAERVADTVEARSSLLGGLQSIARQTVLQVKHVLFGHSDRVFVVAFNKAADPTLLASGGYDNWIIYWNAESGTEYIGSNGQGVRSQHANWVRALDFSPDGTLLASGGYDNVIKIWNVTQPGAFEKSIGVTNREHKDAITSVLFTPDGNNLISSSLDGTIIFWSMRDPRRPTRIATANHLGKIYDLALSPNGNTLVSASADTTARVWDVSNRGNPRLLRELQHGTEVNAVAISPDGRLVATGDDGGQILLWNISTGEQVGRLLGHTNWVLDLDFSPDGRLLASAGRDSDIFLWDVESRTRLGAFGDHEDWVWSVDFNRDGTKLASGSRDETVRVWDVVASQQFNTEVVDIDSPIRAISHSSAETLTLLSSGRILTVAADEENQSPTTQATLELTETLTQTVRPRLSPTGDSVVSIQGQALALWDTNDGRLLGLMEGHSAPIAAIAYNADGTQLASVSCTSPTEGAACSSSELRLWDVATQEQIGEPIVAEEAELTAVAFGNAPGLIAAGGCDRSPEGTSMEQAADEGEADEKNVCTFGQTIVWELATNGSATELIRLVGDRKAEVFNGQRDFVRALAFSPDDRTLVSGSADSTIMFWNWRDGVALRPAIQAHSGAVTGLAFNPSDNILATIGSGQEVLLWDTTRQQRLSVQLIGHTGSVLSLSFSPDGRFLVTGDSDGRVIRWRASFAAWRDLACSIANRNLTQAEWTQYVGPIEGYKEVCVLPSS